MCTAGPTPRIKAAVRPTLTYDTKFAMCCGSAEAAWIPAATLSFAGLGMHLLGRQIINWKLKPFLRSQVGQTMRHDFLQHTCKHLFGSIFHANGLAWHLRHKHIGRTPTAAIT